MRPEPVTGDQSSNHNGKDSPAQPTPKVRPSRWRRLRACWRLYRRSPAYKIPALALRIFVRPIYRYYNDGTNTYAGNVTFFSFLAVFPFLIFISTLSSFIRDSAAAERFVRELLSTLPSGAGDVISSFLANVIHDNNFYLFTGSILGTLWVSSNAVEALRIGLNRAYRVRDTRHYLYHRLKGLIVVIISGLTIILYTTIIVLVPVALHYLHVEEPLRGVMARVREVGGLFLPFVMIPTAMLFHRFLARINYRWRDILPGALVTYALGSALVYGFSAYVRAAGGFNLIYGGLGGVIVLLLFLYLNATVFLIGAEFNAVLHDEILGRRNSNED